MVADIMDSLKPLRKRGPNGCVDSQRQPLPTLPDGHGDAQRFNRTGAITSNQ